MWGESCERCHASLGSGNHGWLVCPLSPDPDWQRSASVAKDLRYAFVTQHVHPGTEIRSKGQWEGFLKRHRLTDDLGLKEKVDRVKSGLKNRKKLERKLSHRRELTKVIGNAYRGVK